MLGLSCGGEGASELQPTAKTINIASTSVVPPINFIGLPYSPTPFINPGTRISRLPTGSTATLNNSRVVAPSNGPTPDSPTTTRTVLSRSPSRTLASPTSYSTVRSSASWNGTGLQPLDSQGLGRLLWYDRMRRPRID